jgi:hypothetical protein
MLPPAQQAPDATLLFTSRSSTSKGDGEKAYTEKSPLRFANALFVNSSADIVQKGIVIDSDQIRLVDALGGCVA